MPLIIDVVEEGFNSSTNEFLYTTIATLTLEHSLISVSKWEAKWHKPYLENDKKTPEQMLDYIRCMSIKGNIADEVLCKLSKENLQTVTDYINNTMTASTVKEPEGSVKGVKRNFITSELIYSWMVSYRIPVEFEKWHLNRLLTLIKVLDEQNKEPEKKSEAQLIKDYARIREENRAKFGIK